MENVIANVERTDMVLFKELEKACKKDENIAAFFSICIEPYSKARNRDLDLASTQYFSPDPGQLFTFQTISLGGLLN